jgi:hypothetical protein
MKKLWIQSILPVLVLSLMAACAKKDDNNAVRVPRSQAPKGTPEKTTGMPTLPDKNVKPQTEPGKDKKITVAPGQPQAPAQPAQPQTPGQPQSPAQPQTPSQPSVVMNLGERYTGAGDDYLRDYLLSKLNSVQDQNIKKRNQAEAEKIQQVRTNIDRETGDVLVTVKRQNNGKVQTIMLGGSLNVAGIAQLAPANNQAIRGTLLCLDRSEQTCFTARIRLEIGEPGNRGIVNIISRRTLANFDYKYPATMGNNREFRRLVDLFDNTERKNGNTHSLRTILVDSFEVMNGRSAIKFSLISHQDEVIVASGPLLAPEDGGILTNVDMERELYLEDLVDLQNNRNFKTSMHKSLNDVRMISNDGQKRFTLSMTVRPDENGDESTLRVTFVRVHRGIKSLTQLQELEKLEQQK